MFAISSVIKDARWSFLRLGVSAKVSCSAFMWFRCNLIVLSPYESCLAPGPQMRPSLGQK